MSTDALLVVDDLEVQFATDDGWVTVLDGVSFTVGRGETVGLVGESGSGKTVTSLATLGLLPDRSARITRGSVRLDGVELVGMPRRKLEALRGDELSMIFQEPMTSLDPAFRVGDQIAEVVRRHRGGSRRAASARAVEVLGHVGIPDAVRRARSYPHEFSGGMRQRVMIAMAMACEPKVIIADEPTTALDVTIQAQVLDLMRAMRDEFGTAVVFVTHDVREALALGTRVGLMSAGRLLVLDTPENFLRSDEPLAQLHQVGDEAFLALGHVLVSAALPAPVSSTAALTPVSVFSISVRTVVSKLAALCCMLSRIFFSSSSSISRLMSALTSLT